MLTTAHLNAKVVRGVIKPAYLPPGDKATLALAEELIAIYRMSIGRPKGQLQDALRGALGTGRAALVGKGLAKLLEDRCTLEVDSPADPVDVRRKLFEYAAIHFPVTPGGRHRTTPRQDALEAVGRELGLEPGQVERAMYADLPSARIVRCPSLPGARWLIDRYNVALAQAVLLRATQVRIRLHDGTPAVVRRLFQYIKFFRLMYRSRPHPDGGYEIDVDGPLSLFKSSNKYGLQLAELVPALLLCPDWTLEATVLWGRERVERRFSLSSTQGLRSHYPARGTHALREIAWLRERLEKIESPWRIENTSAILDLGGQDICIPDAVLRHTDGRIAYLEVIGFWRRSSLERLLATYQSRGPQNLILALSKQLRVSAEGLEAAAGTVTFFRDMINAREVVALADSVGEKPGGPGPHRAAP